MKANELNQDQVVNAIDQFTKEIQQLAVTNIQEEGKTDLPEERARQALFALEDQVKVARVSPCFKKEQHRMEFSVMAGTQADHLFTIIAKFLMKHCQAREAKSAAPKGKLERQIANFLG